MALPLMRRRGPGIRPLIDGVAHGGVGGARAFGAHVALGGEAGHQIGAAASVGEDGALRDGFLHGLQIFRAGMQEQMDMRVDQAGEQRAVAKIDDLRARGMGDGRAHFDDAFAAHQHFAGRDNAAGFDIDQARGVKYDGARGLGAGRAAEREEGNEANGHRALS